MVRFIRNIILFLLPLFLASILLGVFYFYLNQTYEFDSIEKNIERQRNNEKCLLGLGYNEQTQYYKLLNANNYQTPVITLGTSRVMQFKKVYFSTSFYNCGGAVSGNFNEYRNFLENLNYKPQIIILGLDEWIFNDAWNKKCPNYTDYKEITEDNRKKMLLLKSIIIDWYSGKWKLGEINRYNYNIGFNGRIKDNGFMLDGSYYYGDTYREPSESKDYMFVDTKKRIQNGTSRFEWGEHIDDDTLVQLENLLAYCKDNHIEVVGFTPPFAPSIYDNMTECGNYNYINEITPECEQLFDKYNYEFYDYIDGSSLGVTDDYFVDGFHGSEVVYCRILVDMVNKGSQLSNHTNLEHIYKLMENPYSSLVFDNPYKRDVV